MVVADQAAAWSSRQDPRLTEMAAVLDDARQVDAGERLAEAYRRLGTAPEADAAFVEATIVARPLIVPRQRRLAEAAYDALIDEAMRIVRGESSYDPAKLSIVAFLRMVVRRRVVNHLRGEQRRRAREGKAARLKEIECVVADRAPLVNDLAEAEWEEDRLAEARKLLDEADFRFLLAARAGASHAALAEALGGAPVGGGDAKAAVRRAVERVRKRLKRGGLIP